MKRQTQSLTQQIAALTEGSETPTSLTRQALKLATEFTALNAFVSLDESLVLAQADAATRRRKIGHPLSPIDGIPIAIKDNYLTKDYPTTACSNAAPLEPSGIDATIVKNLRDAGAVIFAKTNMHEWAYGATNSTSNIGVTRNPHNLEHITGGSSGGSAAAVASGVVAAALGSDTGGSVRIPSSACGIYGFKPTYGRASRFGVLPLSWSLDAPGVMTHSMEDIAHLLPYILGPDSKDVSTVNAKTFHASTEIDTPTLLNLIGPGLERSKEVDTTLKQALSICNITLEDTKLTGLENHFAAWETILHCEASSYHGNLLQENVNGYSPITRAHLEAGKKITAIELLEAQKLRGRFIKNLNEELPRWDALVLPTLPITAPRHGVEWQEFGGQKVTTQDSMTWFCWLGNLAGLPCLTLPIGKSQAGLPIGMMLMGKPGDDENLLAIATKIDSDING